MVVAVVTAPVSSLIALGFATVEARARFPSPATCHANGRLSALHCPRMCPIRLGTRNGCTGVALHGNDGSRPAFVFLLNRKGETIILGLHRRKQAQDTNATAARDSQRRQARAGQAGKEDSKLDSKFSSSGHQLVARRESFPYRPADAGRRQHHGIHCQMYIHSVRLSGKEIASL